MGMQIKFTICDEDNCSIDCDPEDKSYATICLENGEKINAITSDGKSFWFDCGSCSPFAMNNIQQLIRNRICFVAN